MSEDATWKAVSTLKWKKKQKAPAEPKGFGAILGEAADAVADKWNSTGNLVPAYLKRMTEIQLQDESYIHQQLVKPEEAKPKRGLNRLISGGKGKAGRGIRLLKPNGSRKVRFGDDPHCKAAAGCVKAGGGGTNSASSSTLFAASASSSASKGSSYNKRAAAGAGGLESFSRLHMAEGAAATGEDTVTTAVRTSSSASATAANQPTAIAAGLAAVSAQTVTPGLNSSSTVSKGSSRPQSPAAPARQQLLFCPMPSKQSSVSGHLPRQPSSTPANAAAPNGNRSSGSSADGTTNMMSTFLQQQAMQQPPETPSFAAGSLSSNWAGNSSGHWDEAPSKTELVDKQLQRLRISMAPQVLQEPQQQQQDPASPLGYRPLAIPEELFERWSTVAGGGTSSASALSARRTSVDAPAGAGSAGSRASRRGSNSNIPNSYCEAAQAGTSQRACSNSRESSSNLQSSGSSRDVEVMAVACGGGCGGISSQHSSRLVGDGAISSKQRRTSDYMTALGSIEASLHPRQTGMSGSCSTTPGSISPQQHPSSPRGGRHSSSGIIATRSGSGGSTAGSVARPQRSNSSTLPDFGELQLQHAPSPSKSLGSSGRSSRPSSNPRGNRASTDLQSVPGPLAVVPTNSARATQGRIGSPPTSGGSSSNGNSSSGETQSQHRLSGASAAGEIADAGRKNGVCNVHLPEIGRYAAKQPQTQLAGIGRRR